MNIDEINEIIKDLDNDLKNEVRDFFQPFIDFNNYMLKTYNKTYEDINVEIEKTKNNILAQRISNIDKEESKIEFLINEISIIYREYAEKYNYDKLDEYQKATKIYLEFILKKTLSENGK